MRKHQAEQRAEPEEVLDLESVDVGIMRGFVVVEHQVDDVCRRANEQDLECRVVQRVRESPEQVCPRDGVSYTPASSTAQSHDSPR